MVEQVLGELKGRELTRPPVPPGNSTGPDGRVRVHPPRLPALTCEISSAIVRGYGNLRLAPLAVAYLNR